MPYKKQIDQNKAQLRYWSRNKKYYSQKKEEYRNTIRKTLYEYKLQHPCPCSESDPVCLTFHHKDPKEKEFEIGACISKGLSWEKILIEIAKCEVLCMNCHAKYHAKEKSP